MAVKLPTFDELPAVEGMPQGCAWGVFDQDGEKDVYGTLNLLTPETVKAAAEEVQDGISISLNWPIGSIKMPGFFRKSLDHKVMKLEDHQSGLHYGFDDEVSFNTQASSQWDSLCHFMHQPSGKAYNGVYPTVADMEVSSKANQKLPTIDHWHNRGCVAGRGVMIDFKSYAEAKGIDFSPFIDFRLSPADIEAVAVYQGVTFRPGDILIIRFGMTEALGNMTGEEQAAAMSSIKYCGLEGTVDMARWLWNNHFAAVASDNVAVEAMPPMANGEVLPLTNLILHQWCLGLFGMPLGELWDLKELSEKCNEKKRYAFLLTSSPLNVPGGVGSPPNALAIL
ncbi:hypothetical protein N7532_003058 [Penicillium argentinense]|uniref:Cyclase n=1 Tax=Penicillium argentinense TaxID=1131581 RepID=A0A9W9FLT7_9EURO|nr:uncharacterized protein N7532_003058 [Penicillium argentinense]KAJ5102529.1 hypothetical protein N7532_003058 [Penicillium argentinense]